MDIDVHNYVDEVISAYVMVETKGAGTRSATPVNLYRCEKGQKIPGVTAMALHSLVTSTCHQTSKTGHLYGCSIPYHEGEGTKSR